MEIDWFTFGAQIVNFLILVWLLKRFLYGPILKAIREREQKIADRLQAAAERESAAEQARQSYEEREAELTHLKERLLSDAADEVDAWKRDELQKVREEIAQARQTWRESIVREQQQFLVELRDRTARQVQEVARQVLRELADQDLEQQTIRQFLNQLDGNTEKTLFGRNGHPAEETVIRTAFPLSADSQETLQEKLTSRIGQSRFRFEVDPGLVCGVELVAGDHKLQWNIDHDLESLERSVKVALDQRTEVGADA